MRWTAGRAWLVWGGILFHQGAAIPVEASTPEALYGRTLSETRIPLEGSAGLGPLLEAAQGRRLVLLGESTHGTREFYLWRDALSRRLIAENGFSFIAVEGDWTALVPLDRYVRGLEGAPSTAREALLSIDRWPEWMWANEEFESLAEWLRAYNRERPPGGRVGIHGIDVYGIWQSLEAVIQFYQDHHPEVAGEVRKLYEGLQVFSGDSTAYARHVAEGAPSLGPQVEAVAEKLLRRYREASAEERSAIFRAKQNAKVVKRGELHLRLMAQAGAGSWNARALHFQETVDRLLEYYGPGSQGIVWAHNTHIGDARATSMAAFSQLNIGQLARQTHGPENVLSLGFGTARGRVLAGRQWGLRGEVMSLPPPQPGSLEALMDTLGSGASLWVFTPESAPALAPPVFHRAVGVVYHPELERQRNYVATSLSQRYDAFLFIPQTGSLSPLHPRADRPVQE